MNNKGFTLLELVLYIAMVSIVLSAVIPYAWNVVYGGVKSSSQQEVVSNARFISEKIKYYIRNAVSIDNASSDFDVNLASDSTKKVTLNADAPDSPVVIDVSTGIARVKLGTGATISLNSNDTSVTDLTFSNYSSVDNKTKHLSFSLSVSNNSSVAKEEFRSSITLFGSSELMSN